MTLLICPECDGNVSPYAKSCPHCGYPFACPECDEKISEPVDSCSFCGYPFIAPTEDLHGSVSNEGIHPITSLDISSEPNQSFVDPPLEESEHFLAQADNWLTTHSDSPAERTSTEREIPRIDFRKQWISLVDSYQKTQWKRLRIIVRRRKQGRELVALSITKTNAFLRDPLVVFGIPILILGFFVFIAICLVIDMILHPELFK